MSEPLIIDTKMHSKDAITAAFVVQGTDHTALIETGPKSTVHNVLAALEGFGVDSLDWIVVTHIHLDHAGAAGTLAQHYPEARVAVHEVGAPHLVDPSKLWSSAGRIYGEQMERLWGGIDPLDAERIHVLADGDAIDLGGRRLTALETTGHAGHHHAFTDDATGIMFAGDALGVRLPGINFVRPATPPPEFNLELALSSIERIKRADPQSLWLTHFGPAQDISVPNLCDEAAAALTTWRDWVADARSETLELDEVSELVTRQARAAAEGGLSPDQAERLENTTSYWMNTWGYMRYLDKRAAAR